MPWLMKAEPEPRIVNGHDVSFPVEEFERVKETTWEGVRNHEAKKLMKEDMKMGDKVLFYASNCKTPGVTAIAHVSKEGYPDFTAWDEKHPYFDKKTDKEKPTWYMVSVTFDKRLKYLVSLKLLQKISRDETAIEYLEKEHVDAIKTMALLNRGRLSVQRVTEKAFEAIELLGERGGFEDLQEKDIKDNKKRKESGSGLKKTKRKKS